MEKKTIGKFISALRKANGMTQKELGEKLFVSDKTVSRWECDECTPELSLIPLIAELFGITTDELLRGKRNSPVTEAAVSEDAESRQRVKSDKQFKLMLDRAERKYKNLTLISIGITIFGLIAATVANVGFSMSLIAFCLASAFCVASEICQICFAINTRITPDEDDDTFKVKIENSNTVTAQTAVGVSYVNILMLAFCLPPVVLTDSANHGLSFGSWLMWGLIFAAAAFIACYIVYSLFIRKALCARRIIVHGEKQTEELKRRNKLLKKTIRYAISAALILVVCITVWNIIGWQAFLEVQTFDSCSDFKAFMESDYDRWFTETYGEVYVNGEKIEMSPGAPDYPHSAVNNRLTNACITNHNGEEICSYYYNQDLYWKIDFTMSEDDRMPAKVITSESVYTARNIFFTVQTALYALIGVDFVSAAAAYSSKLRKRKKNL